MSIPVFVGRGGLAKLLGLSQEWVRQLDPPPDALVDNRPAWRLETAARLKAERAARAAQRHPRKRSPAPNSQAAA